MKYKGLDVLLMVFILSANGFSYAQKKAPPTEPQALEAALKKRPQDMALRKKLAQAYFDLNQHKKVIETLAPYSNETDSDGLVLISESYSQMNDHLNSIRILQVYEQKNPDRFRPYYLLGQAFRKNKQNDEAIQNFRKAISLAPQHRPSYEGILEISIENKDQYESRTILSQMIRQFGPKPEFLNTQCKLMSVGGFLAEAEKSCREAISKNKNFPDNHIYLAESLLNQDRKQAAENVYRNAARQFSKSEFVQFAAGEFYFNQKNFPTAVRYLSSAVKIKSDSARSQLGLALSLFETNQHKEALVHFEKACQLDKTKESYNAIREAAAKLHKLNRFEISSEYDKKIGLCF